MRGGLYWKMRIEDALRPAGSRHVKRQPVQSNNRIFLTVYDRMIMRGKGCGEVAPARLKPCGQLAMQVASNAFLSTVI
jgi:hypothetical protein